MGKNQAYKAMQRARLGSSSAGPDEVEDGMVDGSFHSPEWHAARLASLKTSHTVTWEEYKRKQKEDELRKGELEKDTDRMMREYRAQLDAERARKLANGRNHSSSKSDRKKDKKDKDLKKRSSSSSSSSRKRKDLKMSYCLLFWGTTVVYAVLPVLRLSLDKVKRSRANRASRVDRFCFPQQPIEFENRSGNGVVDFARINLSIACKGCSPSTCAARVRRGEARRRRARRGEANPLQSFRDHGGRISERRGEARRTRCKTSAFAEGGSARGEARRVRRGGDGRGEEETDEERRDANPLQSFRVRGGRISESRLLHAPKLLHSILDTWSRHPQYVEYCHSRRRSSESSSSSSSSDSSSSEEDDRKSRRFKSRSKRTKKEKKHKSRTKHSSSSNSDEADGPVPLSRFFESVKS
ncbi:hypothetical protein ACLB2K_002559 [Fragaria x ananassa]